MGPVGVPPGGTSLPGAAVGTAGPVVAFGRPACHTPVVGRGVADDAVGAVRPRKGAVAVGPGRRGGREGRPCGRVRGRDIARPTGVPRTASRPSCRTAGPAGDGASAGLAFLGL